MTGRNWQQLAPVFVRDVFEAARRASEGSTRRRALGAVLGAILLVGDVAGAEARAASTSVACGRVPRRHRLRLSPTLLIAGGFALLRRPRHAGPETITQTVILVETPEEVRGRVMSIWSLLWGLQPLGTLVAGVFADVFNPHIAIGGGGISQSSRCRCCSSRSGAPWLPSSHL